MSNVRGAIKTDLRELIRRQHAEIERLRDEVRNWKNSFVGHVYVKNEDYAELIGKRDALKTDNERLRGLLREAREDVEWLGHTVLVDRIDAALRREPGDG